MNPTLRPIADLFLPERIQYRIPKFQRNFAWSKDRATALLDFVFSIAEQGAFNDTNFIGFMVTDPSASTATDLGVRKFSVIDGQQRLTTFSLTCIAIHQICQDEVCDLKRLAEIAKEQIREALIYEAEIMQEKNKVLYFKYIENQFNKTDFFEDKLKFVPRKINQPSYRNVLECKTDVESETEDNITAAFILIKRLVRKHIVRDRRVSTPRLEALMASLQSIKVVQLELGANDDPQQIFETINYRGMPLSPVDLIRNYIFQDENKSDAFFNEFWDPTEKSFYPEEKVDLAQTSTEAVESNLYDYVRCVLMRKGAYLPKQSVYQYFRDTYNDSVKTEEFLKEFKALSESYLQLTVPRWGRFSKCDPDLISASISLIDLDFAAPIPLLLRMHEDKAPLNEIVETISLCERYYVRRGLIDLRVQQLPKIFVSLCKRYDDRVEGQSVPEWLRELFLIDQKKPADERIFDYPSDDEITRFLATEDVYLRNRPIVQYVYKQLNMKAMGKEYPKDPTDPKELRCIQVEHIMPKSLTSEWLTFLKERHPDMAQDTIILEHRSRLGRIGNLTLTKYNPEMSNKTYELKKPYLLKSAYNLTNMIPKTHNIWDFSEIEKRNSEIIRSVLELFPGI